MHQLYYKQSPIELANDLEYYIKTMENIPSQKVKFFRVPGFLFQKANKNFDLTIYIGNLPFNSFPLLKVPKRFEPKKFNFIGSFWNRKT